MNRNEFEQAVYASGLDAASRHILMYYASVKHWKTDGNVWPSMDSIARDTGLGRRTVARKVPVLRDLGWLVETGETKTNGKGRPSVVYGLTIGATQTPKVEVETEPLVPLCQDFGANLTTFGATETNFGATVALDNEGYCKDIEKDNEQATVSDEPVAVEVLEEESTSLKALQGYGSLSPQEKFERFKEYRTSLKDRTVPAAPVHTNTEKEDAW
jgi:hypothetical protein